MIPGLYSAATGMLATEKRQDVISNNIANAATTGFKRQSPVQLGFYHHFVAEQRHPFHFNVRPAPGGGAKIVETFPHLEGGPLTETGNPLNVALQGPGFVAVETPGGERYTRSGDFTVDIDGDLATKDGFKVASVQGGPITVGDGRVGIGRDGSVRVDGVVAGRVRMVEFEDPKRLLRQGKNLYAASEEVSNQSAEAADTSLEQGFLEMSNVSVPREMVNMLMAVRTYEANQKVITTLDATIGQLIERVASP